MKHFIYSYGLMGPYYTFSGTEEDFNSQLAKENASSEAFYAPTGAQNTSCYMLLSVYSSFEEMEEEFYKLKKFYKLKH